mmetsp:Transcript_12662/g.32390  ORF Transcript_12662/g.32390 Transcript_12662/m.32390 type:complete len:428 (-) Transcript_12662:591-1874(-)
MVLDFLRLASGGPPGPAGPLSLREGRGSASSADSSCAFASSVRSGAGATPIGAGGAGFALRRPEPEGLAGGAGAATAEAAPPSGATALSPAVPSSFKSANPVTSSSTSPSAPSSVMLMRGTAGATSSGAVAWSVALLLAATVISPAGAATSSVGAVAVLAAADGSVEASSSPIIPRLRLILRPAGWESDHWRPAVSGSVSDDVTEKSSCFFLVDSCDPACRAPTPPPRDTGSSSKWTLPEHTESASCTASWDALRTPRPLIVSSTSPSEKAAVRSAPPPGTIWVMAMPRRFSLGAVSIPIVSPGLSVSSTVLIPSATATTAPVSARVCLTSSSYRVRRLATPPYVTAVTARSRSGSCCGGSGRSNAVSERFRVRSSFILSTIGPLISTIPAVAAASTLVIEWRASGLYVVLPVTENMAKDSSALEGS